MKKIFLTIVLFFPVILFSQVIKTAVEPRVETVVEPRVETDKDTLDFQVIDEVPVFPGCEDLNKNELGACFNEKIRNHIIKYFFYPQEAIELEIEGKIAVTFVINRDGNVDRIIATGGYSILRNAAEKIFLRLPKMKPGMIAGKPVNVRYTMPINFKLQ